MADEEQKVGPYRVVPGWWRKLVREEFQRRGRGAITQCAEDIGCAQSAVSQLIAPPRPGKPSPGSSRIAEGVAKWTGVPLPDEAALEEFAELVSEAKRLKASDPDLSKEALDIIRSLRKAAERNRP